MTVSMSIKPRNSFSTTIPGWSDTGSSAWGVRVGECVAYLTDIVKHAGTLWVPTSLHSNGH